MSQSVKFGRNDMDAPAPRGMSDFSTPPSADWIRQRLESALKIDRSFHAATTIGVAEVRNIAACAVFLAKALAEIREMATTPAKRPLRRARLIREFAVSLVGESPALSQEKSDGNP